MTDIQSRLEMLEARTVAHRRLLARLVAASDRATRETVADWLVGQEINRLAPSDHGKAERLVEVRRDLGEELVIGKPDRDRNPDFAFDRCLKVGQTFCR